MSHDMTHVYHLINMASDMANYLGHGIFRPIFKIDHWNDPNTYARSIKHEKKKIESASWAHYQW